MKNTENLCVAGGLCAILAISTTTLGNTSPSPAVPRADAEWIFTVKAFPSPPRAPDQPTYLTCTFTDGSTYNNSDGAFTVKGHGRQLGARCDAILVKQGILHHNQFTAVFVDFWSIDHSQTYTCPPGVIQCSRMCSAGTLNFCLGTVIFPASTLTITYDGTK